MPDWYDNMWIFVMMMFGFVRGLFLCIYLFRGGETGYFLVFGVGYDRFEGRMDYGMMVGGLWIMLFDPSTVHEIPT